MANGRIIKARDLAGMFIYQDPKHGTIFYDIFTRKGYVLTTSDVRTYTFYTMMLPLCILLSFSAMSIFSLNYLSCFIIFISLYLIASVAFRFMFFYKLPLAKNFKPVKKESIFLYMARGYSAKRLMFLIVLLVALTIVTPVYAYMEHYEDINLYSSWILATGAAIGAIVISISLVLKLKNNY